MIQSVHVISILLLLLLLFSGGLVFGINAVGRRTGEAVAVLENEEQTTLALQRDRHYMEKRYIEVRIQLIVFIYCDSKTNSYKRKIGLLPKTSVFQLLTIYQ